MIGADGPLPGVPTRTRSAYIAGYAVSHDVSEREFQIERGGQWDKGKNCETFNPLGPWLVTADEVADPQALALRLWVNGELRQDGTTGEQIFPVRRRGLVPQPVHGAGPGRRHQHRHARRASRSGSPSRSRTCAPATWWSWRSTASAGSGRRSGRPEHGPSSTGSRRWSPAAPPASAWPSADACAGAGRPGRRARPRPRRRRCPPASTGRPTADVTRRRVRACRRWREAVDGARRPRRPGQQRRHRRAGRPSTDNADDEWHRVLDVNVVGHGPGHPGRAAAPASRPATPPSSTPARSPRRPACRSARSTRASKGAVLSLTRAMAADHVREGIRVNAVNPGTADTPWVGGCSTPPTTRPPSARRSRRGSRTAGWCPPTRSPRPSPTSPRRRPGRRPAPTLAVDGGMAGLRLRPRP